MGDVSKLSLEQIMQIVAEARQLHSLDEQEDLPMIEGAARSLALVGDKTHTAQSAYDIAHLLGTPDQYVKRIIDTRHPSIDQQLSDVNAHDAKFSVGAVIETYRTKILNRLRLSFPSEDFEDEGSSVTESGKIDGEWRARMKARVYSFNRVALVRQERRRLFRGPLVKQWKLPTPLGIIGFSGSVSSVLAPVEDVGIDLQVKDPCFLRACGDELKALNEKFKAHVSYYSVVTDYTV